MIDLPFVRWTERAAESLVGRSAPLAWMSETGWVVVGCEVHDDGQVLHAYVARDVPPPMASPAPVPVTLADRYLAWLAGVFGDRCLV